MTRLAGILRYLDRLLLGPKPVIEPNWNRVDLEISAFEVRKTKSEGTSLWATIKNLTEDEVPIEALRLLLCYGVNPGRSYMPGGNGIESWRLFNSAKEASAIPANTTSTMCICGKDDPISLIWNKKLNDSDRSLRRDYDWLCSELRKPDGLISLLSAKKDMWLELRAPDWAPYQDAKRCILRINQA